ncbi:hypothetical protein ON010_g7757 [Phytophthora cinnamomi]|nr:hypothetical protein ON010_g7757 [Phytophthora cinnamomi]
MVIVVVVWVVVIRNPPKAPANDHYVTSVLTLAYQWVVAHSANYSVCAKVWGCDDLETSPSILVVQLNLSPVPKRVHPHFLFTHVRGSMHYAQFVNSFVYLSAPHVVAWLTHRALPDCWVATTPLSSPTSPALVQPECWVTSTAVGTQSRSLVNQAVGSPQTSRLQPHLTRSNWSVSSSQHNAAHHFIQHSFSSVVTNPGFTAGPFVLMAACCARIAIVRFPCIVFGYFISPSFWMLLLYLYIKMFASLDEVLVRPLTRLVIYGARHPVSVTGRKPHIRLNLKLLLGVSFPPGNVEHATEFN